MLVGLLDSLSIIHMFMPDILTTSTFLQKFLVDCRKNSIQCPKYGKQETRHCITILPSLSHFFLPSVWFFCYHPALQTMPRVKAILNK
jgi:hypothetical protein